MNVRLFLLIGCSLLTAGCAGLVDLQSSDLPAAAIGGATCGGSTVARGATTESPPRLATDPVSRPSAPHSVLYSAPSQEDATATALYVVNIDRTARREIIHGFFDALNPIVSPDGRLVAFVRQSASLQHPRLMAANVDGSNLRTLYQSVNYVDSISWSPDSRRLAFLADDALKTVDITGGAHARTIATISDQLADVWTDAVAWSPDGSTIAFLDGYWLGLDTLTLVGPDGSRRRDLVTSTGSFAWSPRGDSIAFTNGGISIVPLSGGKLRHLVATPQGTGVEGLAWSRDGRSIVFQSGDVDVVDLCRVSIASTTLTQVAGCIPARNEQDLSKDDQTIVFVQATGPDCDHSPDHKIALIALNGGAVSLIADIGWSPQWLGE